MSVCKTALTETKIEFNVKNESRLGKLTTDAICSVLLILCMLTEAGSASQPHVLLAVFDDVGYGDVLDRVRPIQWISL